MVEGLLVAILLAVLVVIGIQIFAWMRPRSGPAAEIENEASSRLDTLLALNERVEKALREEAQLSRSSSAGSAKELRDEVRGTVKDLNTSVTEAVAQLGIAQGSRLDGLQKSQIDHAIALKGDLERRLTEFGTSSSSSFIALSGQISQKLKDHSELTGQRIEDFATQLKNLSSQHELAAKNLRESVESRLSALQTENANKLEEMRKTVDEKLQGTLERRLGESFKQVSDRLEQVHRGLGEIQSLGSNVADLSRLMSNVKARGTWGEWRLGGLLEQMLSPDQFRPNFQPNASSREVVEYAIRMPGSAADGECWLPIDSKYPIEAFERVSEAATRADAAAVQAATSELRSAVRKCAKDISVKYLHPPLTTDFVVLFLPVEGLFAEVLRCDGLVEELQRDFRVTVTGPTTLAAFVNCLQMGFRTLAIQKRSSEVWQVLGAIKTEFEKFGEMLDKVDKKLDEAKSSVERATGKTRTIRRKLRDVQALPAGEAVILLPSGDDLDAMPDPDDGQD